MHKQLEKKVLNNVLMFYYENLMNSLINLTCIKKKKLIFRNNKKGLYI